MALELGCYICTLGARVDLVPDAVFNDGKSDLCLGFCLQCNGSVCTNHGAWLETPSPQYTCSVCLGDWIWRGGDGGPLHRRVPEPQPAGGGGRAQLSSEETLDAMDRAGVKDKILAPLRTAFMFWAHRIYETSDLAQVRIVEPVALRNIYNVYMEASGMAKVVKAAQRAVAGASS
jgi:hypothetical protein